MTAAAISLVGINAVEEYLDSQYPQAKAKAGLEYYTQEDDNLYAFYQNWYKPEGSFSHALNKLAEVQNITLIGIKRLHLLWAEGQHLTKSFTTDNK